MLKKVVMLVLCLGLCTVTAFAAYGAVGSGEAQTGETAAEAKLTLGENKGNNMTSVIKSAFDLDLTGYQFVSFGDLWDNAAETTYPALRAIAIDR